MIVLLVSSDWYLDLTCVNYDCHTGKEVETPSTVNNSLIQDYTCPDDYANLWNDSRNQTIYNKHLSSYLLWMRYVFCFPDFPIKTQREKKNIIYQNYQANISFYTAND